MTSSTISIASRIWEVRDGIERACARVGRPPDAVTLIAISKTQPAEAIIEAAAAGIVDFGENRIQEALPKIPILQSSSGGPVRFHFVGHLQKNKAALAAANFESVHSVDSPRLVQALGRAADDESSLEVFLQVNVSGEESKFGVAPAELPQLVEETTGLRSLSVRGLMTIPPPAVETAELRRIFSALRRLGEQHSLECLSMGMTEDFEVAIEEGATHVRVGRAIFGERQP